MIRSAALALALLATPTLSSAQHYRAEPVVQPVKAKIAIRDTLWNCAAVTCSAKESSSRSAVVCAVLARQVGPLRSFSAGGQALGAEELDRCNARAKALKLETVRTAASR